ncbi:MAG: SPASM domain-containing protein [Flavobacteriales bacterium]|nr:SPASM domain-containing protein [Flavobacteriales bacterium]
MKAQLLDIINYLKVLSTKKLINAFRILGSYYVSRLTKKNKHRGLPIAISIEPTTSCNLRCPQCPSGLRQFTRETGMLQPDLNKTIIDQLKKTLTYITYYFQGEPYLNPDFLEMVNYASQSNIYTATSTNAHYLTPENCKKTITSGLKRLTISIDGTSQDTYGKYRIGGNIEKVLEGTKNIVQAKKEAGRGPYIIWQFIVFSHNTHQIDEIKKLAKQYGVDKLAIKTAQVYDFENDTNLIPTESGFKYARYKMENGKMKIKSKLLNHCWRLWHNCVITWDGKVVPCCFDKDAKHQFGDINLAQFKSIWQSAEYSSFRLLILKSRRNIDICRNCTEGTSIWA